MAAARSPVRIETRRLVLLMPPPSEAGRVVDYFERNRAHLEPWDPPRPAAFYTRQFWEEQLEKNRRELAEGRSMRLFLEPKQPKPPLIGTCNFTNFVRGAFQACNVGYGLDEKQQGRGMMREALEAAVDYAFRELKLHRVMANYMPTNERSGQLLRSLGFTVEGYARDYLYINGRWCDHVLTSIVSPGGQPPAAG